MRIAEYFEIPVLFIGIFASSRYRTSLVSYYFTYFILFFFFNGRRAKRERKSEEGTLKTGSKNKNENVGSLPKKKIVSRCVVFLSFSNSPIPVWLFSLMICFQLLNFTLDHLWQWLQVGDDVSFFFLANVYLFTNSRAVVLT